MEIKAIVYHLVSKFRIEPNEKTQIPLKLKKTPVSVTAEDGVQLRFKPRD